MRRNPGPLAEYGCSDFVTPGCDAEVFNRQHATGLFTSRDRNFFQFISTDSSFITQTLSGRGKATIGITIPLLFLALIAGAFLFFRRRNSGIQQEHHELPTSSPSIEGSSWTKLNEMQKQKNEASELDSTVVSEAGVGNHAVELGDWRRSVVYEMEESFGGASGWRGGEGEEQERRAQHHQT